MEDMQTTDLQTSIEPSPPAGKRFTRVVHWLMGASAGMALFGLWMSWYLSAWQYLGFLSVSVVGMVAFWFASRLFQVGKVRQATMLVVWVPWILAPLCVLFVDNALLLFALVAVFLPPFLTGTLLPHEQMPLIWMGGTVAASITIAFNYLIPWPRYDVAQSFFTQMGVYAALAFVGGVIVIEITHAYQRIMTIRYRLLTMFVMVVVLAVVGAATVSVLVSLGFARQQVFDRLEAVSELQQVAIDTWIEGLKLDLDALITSGYELTYVTAATAQSQLSNVDYAVTFLTTHFQKMVERAQRFDEIFLMNLEGQVVVSTDATQQGKVLSYTPFFQQGLIGYYVQAPQYDVTTNRIVVYVSKPAYDQLDNVVGVLVGRVNLEQLNTILSGYDIFEGNGETYLVTTNNVLLTSGLHADIYDYVHSAYIDEVLVKRTTLKATSSNYGAIPSYAVATWLESLEVVLIAELDAAQALKSARAMVATSIVFSLVAILLAMIVAQFFARGITQPLSELAVTASRIAEGETELRATVERQDEVGALAMAFNSMTEQLREFIGSLEARVDARTRDLAAVADVSRTTTSVLDPDKLLPQVVSLVRERFNLYYVGLFLVDDAREYAVLRAGTGDAGREMMAEGWRLLVGGESMIGQCVVTGVFGVKQTAGDEAVRFENPYLPDTRSELALPLRYGDQIIGSMTVQSVVDSAFDNTYITLLQNMADQVAVAVQNARLFTETQKSLARARAAQQRYQGLAWDQYIQGRTITGYERRDIVLNPLDETLLPETAEVVHVGQTVMEPGRLMMPIIQGSRVVGVLGFEREDRTWSADDVALIEALSEQLVLAADNQRLLDETQRTADRERILGRISARVREELQMEHVLRTAVDEIQRTLDLERLVVRMVPQEDET